MYTLSTDFPLGAYVGQRVHRLFEGAHFVELHLEGADTEKKGYVQFEGPVGLKIPGRSERRIENKALVEGNTVFQPLLGATVDGVERISEKSCRFLFSNGWALDLIGDSSYESYHLRVAGRLLKRVTRRTRTRGAPCQFYRPSARAGERES